MAKAGYCSQCGQNVWLTADGSCSQGHGSECISNVYDSVPPAPAASDVAVSMPTPVAAAKAVKVPIHKRKWFLPAAMGFLGLLVGTAIASPSGTAETGTVSNGADAKSSARIESLQASVTALAAERDELKAKVDGYEGAAAQKAAEEAAAAKAAEEAAAAKAAEEAAAAKAAEEAAAAKAEADAAAAAQKTTTSTKSTASKGETVYITESGEKYHRAGCQYLSHSQFSISLSEAKAQGYTACSRCF